MKGDLRALERLRGVRTDRASAELRTALGLVERARSDAERSTKDRDRRRTEAHDREQLLFGGLEERVVSLDEIEEVRELVAAEWQAVARCEERVLAASKAEQDAQVAAVQAREVLQAARAKQEKLTEFFRDLERSDVKRRERAAELDLEDVATVKSREVATCP